MTHEEKVEALLIEAVRWLRILAGPTVNGWLEPILATSEERRVYQASNGGSLRQVGTEAGVAHKTVQRFWEKWAAAHPPIITATTTSGRYQRLYDLTELNIPIEVA